MTDEAKKQVTKEQIDDAFKLVVDGIDLAMMGRFQKGLDHIDSHAKLRDALFLISDVLNACFSVPAVEPDEAKPAGLGRASVGN